MGQSGPLILDRQLQPVWFQPVPERVVAANLSLQSYHGKPVLAWWQGKVTNTGATESGEDVVVNQHYQPVATAQGHRRLGADGARVPDRRRTRVGDGQQEPADGPVEVRRRLQRRGDRLGGPGVRPQDGQAAVQLGRAASTSRWASRRPRCRPTASRGTPTTSTRSSSWGRKRSWCRCATPGPRTSSTPAPGAIEWTLGGRQIELQVRLRSRIPVAARRAAADQLTTVTVFDDHCCQLTGGGSQVEATAPSRGLVLKLDQATRTATLAGQLRSRSEGGIRLHGRHPAAANGNVFVGWGNEPYFSEYSRTRGAAVRRRTPRTGPQLPGHGRAVGRVCR